MRRKDFYSKIVDALNDGYMNARERRNELKKLENDYNSDVYYLLKNDILKEINAKRIEIDSIVRKTYADFSSIAAEYVESLKERDLIKADELTDDVKLLTSGLPLLERDLKGIIDRSGRNRTMVQLCMRYAREHNMILNGYWYVPAESEKTSVDAVVKTIETVFKYNYDECSYNKTYNALVNKGTELYEWAHADCWNNEDD